MAITPEQKKAFEAAGYTVKGNTVKNKDGGSVGGYNENGKIWSGSSKVRDILKSSPKSENPPKKSNTPSASSRTEKPSAKPKANPARKPGGARPEGKALGMPAAKKPKGSAALAASAPILGAAAKVASSRKPAVAKPFNPSYSGAAKSPEGPQGRINTTVARPRPAGGGRAIGFNPARRIRGPGGGGVLKMPDVLDLRNMAKGGLVSKRKK